MGTAMPFLGLGCSAISGTSGTSMLISVVQCRHALELPVASSHKDTHTYTDAHILPSSSLTKKFTLSLKFESMFLRILTWQEV